MMTEKRTTKQSKAEYRQHINPKQFNDFLTGEGLLNNPAELAEPFDYDWHARKLLGDLESQQGVIFVFDGGYWRLDPYQDIGDPGNDFVTKRAGNIKPHLIKELPLPEEPLASGYTVLQDALVYLGDDPTQPYRMLKVQLSTDEIIVLITSLLDASADQICLLYRYRWPIEILFRWLRQTLQLDHLISHDPTGLLRQILTALIVWGLLVIANQDTGRLSPKQLWRQLQADLHQAILEFGYRLGLHAAPT